MGGLDTLETITLLVMLIGLVGAFVPLLPGPLIVWLAAVVYNIVRGFTLRSGIVLAIMTLLMLAGSTAELWMGGIGARRSGASGCAIALALVAGVIGLILFSVVGAILLPVLTVLVVELVRLRDPRKAIQAGGGYFIGWLISAVFDLVVVLVMIALWLWQIGGWRAIVNAG